MVVMALGEWHLPECYVVTKHSPWDGVQHTRECVCWLTSATAKSYCPAWLVMFSPSAVPGWCPLTAHIGTLRFQTAQRERLMRKKHRCELHAASKSAKFPALEIHQHYTLLKPEEQVAFPEKAAVRSLSLGCSLRFWFKSVSPRKPSYIRWTWLNLEYVQDQPIPSLGLLQKS